MQASSSSLRRCARTAATPVRAAQRKGVVLRAAVQDVQAAARQEDSTPSTSSNSKGQEIYIGFAKGQERSPGSKGRVIRDDPSKYPNKEDIGVFSGVVGGWAGGEQALWQLREQVEREKQAKKATSSSGRDTSSGGAANGKRPAPGKDLIYVGYGKSDLELRKSGQPGRVIVDDPRKYPSKEDIGLLSGATGGFAGGEKGVQMFVEEGELRLRAPGAPGPRQFSAVELAFVLIAAGAGGGTLLNAVTSLGETAVLQEVQQLAATPAVDENSKLLLVTALGLLGSAGAILSGRAAVSSLQQRLKAGSKRLLALAAFWVVVFIAARAILET